MKSFNLLGKSNDSGILILFYIYPLDTAEKYYCNLSNGYYNNISRGMEAFGTFANGIFVLASKYPVWAALVDGYTTD